MLLEYDTQTCPILCHNDQKTRVENRLNSNIIHIININMTVNIAHFQSM